uniref:Zasp-like motif domain-containing protein n=1 Tax=Angiostrongylus cantonensis TaxID=6313 RepID=A0A0K0DM21_ANGCA
MKPSEYTMGKAVYTSVDDVEKMRDGINRMSSYESRPITPAHSVVSGRFTPYGHEAYAPSSYKRNISLTTPVAQPSKFLSTIGPCRSVDFVFKELMAVFTLQRESSPQNVPEWDCT